jgi:hypothetical protein
VLSRRLRVLLHCALYIDGGGKTVRLTLRGFHCFENLLCQAEFAAAVLMATPDALLGAQASSQRGLPSRPS